MPGRDMPRVAANGDGNKLVGVAAGVVEGLEAGAVAAPDHGCVPCRWPARSAARYGQWPRIVMTRNAAGPATMRNIVGMMNRIIGTVISVGS